jgi:hypothetical protein
MSTAVAAVSAIALRMNPSWSYGCVLSALIVVDRLEAAREPLDALDQ